jgi:hypothetical protein
LDEAIEEMRKMMLDLVEDMVSTRKMDERETAQEARMMQEWRQQRIGAERQLQEKVWNPRGFQPRWKSHEQELMIFVVVGYDAGASLHLNMCQLDFTYGVHLREERHLPLIFPQESRARSSLLRRTSWKR